MITLPQVGFPLGFFPHQFEREFPLRAERASVWHWLNRTETFTEGQIWPYRVEFLSPQPEVPPYFYEGVFTAHHGPFLQCAGLLCEIREPEYRDLSYFYGSYVISFRWVRPVRLQFWLEQTGPGLTQVRLQLDTYVKESFLPIWKLGVRLFWSFFEAEMRRHLER